MKTIKARINNGKRLNVSGFGWLILAGVFIILWYYMDNYIMYTLNSDHSSDLVLGHMLAEENSLISRNWCYSTVLKVVDINLIWAALFKLTDNWHTVRVIGSVLIYLMILLCLRYLCVQAGMKKYFGYMGAMLLLPVSKDYFDIVMRGVYYSATILNALLVMGLWMAFLKSGSGKRPVLLAAAGVVISAVGGLGGPMQLVMFNIPMVLAALLCCLCTPKLNKLRVLGFSLLMAAAAVVGYVFSSKVLAEMYQFQNYENMLFEPVSITGIINVINGWISVFGYRSGEPVFSLALLMNASAGLWVLLSTACAVQILRSERHSLNAKLLGALYLSYLVTMLLVFSMSSKTFIARYMVLAVIFGVTAVFAYFNERTEKASESNRIIAGLMALALLCGALNYNEMRKIDDTKGLREAAKALVEQGYTQGYATFWNANIVTELSNGQLELWHWNDGKQKIADLEDFNDIYPWLQAKSHLTEVPSGKVFVLLSANEDYYFEFTKKFSQDDVIYRAENYYDYSYKDYIAYGFESYEELSRLLSQ